jgi:hypothetical protein
MQQVFIQTTEAASLYDNLDKMSVSELLKSMNEEDKKVPNAVEAALPQIEAFVTAAYNRMREGGYSMPPKFRQPMARQKIGSSASSQVVTMPSAMLSNLQKMTLNKRGKT